MIALKYKSIPFGKMSQQGVLFTGKALLLKINVITGWVIPEDNLDILIELFVKKLLLSYGEVNADELEFAFITHGTIVKDWGKSMNLSLIDEVMIPYLEKRVELSRIEEQTKAKEIINQPKEDLSEKAMVEWWKDLEKKVRTEKYPMEFMPVSLYDWMDKQGGIDSKIADFSHPSNMYLVKAMEFRHAKLEKEFRTGQERYSQENKNKLARFVEMRKEGCFTGPEVKILEDIAKRMIIYDMMAL